MIDPQASFGLTVLQVVLFFASWGIPFWLPNWWANHHTVRTPRPMFNDPDFDPVKEHEFQKIESAVWEAHHSNGMFFGVLLELAAWGLIFWGLPRLF